MSRDMSREFFSGNFMQMTELAPTHTYHHQFELPMSQQASPTVSSSYEMTAAADEANGTIPGIQPQTLLPPPTLPSHPHHDARRRRISNFAYDSMPHCDSSMSACSSSNVSSTAIMPATSSTMPATSTMPTPNSRKRKTSSYGASSTYDEDGDDSHSTRSNKKQNHSEIEKRRRDKINAYITELSSMVPMCGAMARKLDKLTVLRMAVQHLRSVRGAAAACPLAARPLPAFVTERELNSLVLHAARDSFLLVVGCDRGRLLYVSASVTAMLHYEQSELLGQSLFDILHPKDVAKVKEQLSSSDLSPSERLIDAKTMLPVKAELGAETSRLCPGARRSFFCRIKCKSQAGPVKEELEAHAKIRKKTHEKKYCVVQCTGYLKSWAPAEVNDSGAGDVAEEEQCNLSCLVAVGRAMPTLTPPPVVPPAAAPLPDITPPLRRLQFASRHAIDGKYLFVDQRVTLALGYLPQELLGTSLYEYVANGELSVVARAHKAALVRRRAARTPPYSARRKDGERALLHTHFKPFRNPWTKDVECLVAQNTLISEAQASAEEAAQAAYDDLEPADGASTSSDLEVQRLISSQVEAHRIGSAIAEEALRRLPGAFSPELPADLMQDAAFHHQAIVDTIIDNDLAYQVRNNVPLCAANQPSPPAACSGCAEPEPEENEEACVEVTSPEDTVPSQLTLDGNGEAAMAVIMSLLEAETGLGGPVNFSGLPWPLP